MRRRLGAAVCWLFGHKPLPHDSDSTGGVAPLVAVRQVRGGLGMTSDPAAIADELADAAYTATGRTLDRPTLRAALERVDLWLIPPGGLVTVTQIGRRLGVSRQMAGKLVRRRDLFPWSMTVGRVTLYRAVDMERAATVERRPGRRPKGES